MSKKIVLESDQSNVPRATKEIPAAGFKKLLQLNFDCRWLQEESDALLELWNFCDIEDQQDLLSDLLRRFEMIESSRLKSYGEDVAKTILDDWGATANSTRIIAVSDEKDADGSQFFIQSLKNKFPASAGWQEENFINNIRDGVNETKNGYKVVLVDDFIGTGKTIIRKYDWFVRELNKIAITADVYVIAIAGMEGAKSSLDKSGIKHYCPLWIKRGISDFYKGSDLVNSTQNMKNLEKKLHHFYKGLYLPRFGYKRSESLFCVHAFNCPNNVFPIFWWPISKKREYRKTLLTRLR